MSRSRLRYGRFRSVLTCAADPDRGTTQAMLEAAASALALAAAGAVTARGTLGPLLTREPDRPAGDGDPTAYHWKRAQAEWVCYSSRADSDWKLPRGCAGRPASQWLPRSMVRILTTPCGSPRGPSVADGLN